MHLEILGNVRIELFLNFLKKYVPVSLWKHPDTPPGQQNWQKALTPHAHPMPSQAGALLAWVSKGGGSEAGGPLAVADTFNHSKDWGFHLICLGTKEIRR